MLKTSLLEALDEYKTIIAPSEGLYKEKGSKFIAFVLPASGEEAIKEHLSRLRKEYHDARHHCYAYRLGMDKSVMRYNDDGEPSGTAGKPIYGQILSFGLTNVLVVVIRYFGGTKLGIGGLINAYKSAARDAVMNGKIVTRNIRDVFGLHFKYPLMNDVMRIIKEENLEITEQSFQVECDLKMAVRQGQAERISGRFAKIHGVEIQYIETI